MLQGIRASTLTVPSFGHSLSLTGAQKMDGYGELDPWGWPSHQSNSLTQSYPAVFDQSLYSSLPNPPPTVQPRHHSIATSHPANLAPAAQPQTGSPPPPRQQGVRNMVKAQPAFKATWHGFLDTTMDAMTIVEAALQGRLSHISRRPHDKERAEMLRSGTVLVYEENASGIKRWTDAVHWSPSRVMNNCLIYRQLVRALKPEEKKAALNPSCGSKRKRKEGASPSVTNSRDIVKIVEDEYEHASMEAQSNEATPTEPYGKVYANFAQNLTPEQQRRFCGSLIDSYEFKEGGLMKKTISVKYQGTHHHIISYYSLEDVVNGKLKRPSQDPNLADIHPRPELLAGWKVSLEDEECKETPLFAGYSQHMHPSHVQHSAVNAPPHGLPAQSVVQAHAPLHLQMPSDYWHGNHNQSYTQPQASPPNYAPAEHTPSPYAQQVSQQYPTQQSSAQQFHSQRSPSQQYPQQSPNQQYPQQLSPQKYSAQAAHSQHYPAHPTQGPCPTPQYLPQPQAAEHYPPVAPAQQYSEQHATPQYPEPQPPPTAQQAQFTVPQVQTFDLPIHVAQTTTPVQQSPHDSVPQHDSLRRASAPVTITTYGQPPSQPQYQPDMQPQAFYIPDQKYDGGGYGY